MPKKRDGGDFIVEFTESVKRFMVDSGVSESVADFVSVEMANFICKEWGGSQPYIPVKLHAQKDECCAKIYDDFYFKKKTLHEISSEYRICHRVIRKYLNAEGLRRQEQRRIEDAARKEESQRANWQRWKKENC
ncbi:MAG: hypothetical protein JSR83_10125 [Proteobacteria bacterium]|nr:hypothetical protein [Pseudomonadota bacterium]